MEKFRVFSSKLNIFFQNIGGNFELQTTLASQVEVRFEPNLDQIWDQKISTSVWSFDPNQPGKNFDGALEGGDFTVLIYYLLLHHQGDRGTKTKWDFSMFCLRSSKNSFQIFGANFELQTTLASQVEARFGPNVGPKISKIDLFMKNLYSWNKL